MSNGSDSSLAYLQDKPCRQAPDLPGALLYVGNHNPCICIFMHASFSITITTDCMRIAGLPTIARLHAVPCLDFCFQMRLGLSTVLIVGPLTVEDIDRLRSIEFSACLLQKVQPRTSPTSRPSIPHSLVRVCATCTGIICIRKRLGFNE